MMLKLRILSSGVVTGYSVFREGRRADSIARGESQRRAKGDTARTSLRRARKTVNIGRM